MSPEQKAAYVQAQTAMLTCRLAGMVAENQLCQYSGLAPKYTAEHFLAVELEFTPMLGSNEILISFAA